MTKTLWQNLDFAKFKLDSKFFLENKFLIVIFAAGLIFLIVGIVQLIVSTNNDNSGNTIELISSTDKQQGDQGDIVVDVEGAVAKPGVYTLKGGSRVSQAIEAAGNFSADVDAAWIAKNLNLAAKISDGAKIYIPKKGEGGQIVNSNSQMTPTNGKININTSSTAQLDSLPSVGTVTANKIISGRPYNSVEELLTRKIIGKSTFDKIKDLISIY